LQIHEQEAEQERQRQEDVQQAPIAGLERVMRDRDR
jgi:hypothetical protein